MEKKYKLEYIEWEDVVSGGNAWCDEEEVEKWIKDQEGTWLVRECGFVLKETKKYIVLCSHYKVADSISGEQFGHLQKIIKSLIRKRKNIKI